MPRRSGGSFALSSGGKTNVNAISDYFTTKNTKVGLNFSLLRVLRGLRGLIPLSNLPALGNVCRSRPSIHRKLERRKRRLHPLGSPTRLDPPRVRPRDASRCSCSQDQPSGHARR